MRSKNLIKSISYKLARAPKWRAIGLMVPIPPVSIANQRKIYLDAIGE